MISPRRQLMIWTFFCILDYSNSRVGRCRPSMYDRDYSFLHPLDHPVPEINKRQGFYQKYLFNPLCVLLLRLLYVLFDLLILLFLILLLLFHTLLIFSLQRTHCSRALGSMGAVRFCYFTIARYCFTIMEHMKSMIMTVRIFGRFAQNQSEKYRTEFEVFEIVILSFLLSFSLNLSHTHIQTSLDCDVHFLSSPLLSLP